MSDIDNLIKSIDALTNAVVAVTQPVSTNVDQKKATNKSVNPSKKTDKPAPEKISPPPNTAETKSLKLSIDSLNISCIKKSTDVPNAKLLISHRLLNVYKVKGIGTLPETHYEEFSQFVKAITEEDVQVFISSQERETQAS